MRSKARIDTQSIFCKFNKYSPTISKKNRPQGAFALRTIDCQTIKSLQSYYSSVHAEIFLYLLNLGIGLCCCLGIVSSSLHLAAHFYIELDLRLCARRTD